jgi:hypothetical protein
MAVPVSDRGHTVAREQWDHQDRPSGRVGQPESVASEVPSISPAITATRGHPAADDPTAAGIEHDRHIEKARPGRNVGDVGDPQLIRPLRGKVAVNQIPRLTVAAFDRRADEFATARTDKTCRRHQPGDALATDANALGRKIDMNARRSVGAVRSLMCVRYCSRNAWGKVIASDYQGVSKAAVMGDKGTIEWNAQFNRANVITLYDAQGKQIEQFIVSYKFEGFEYEVEEAQNSILSNFKESRLVTLESSVVTQEIISQLMENTGTRRLEV